MREKYVRQLKQLNTLLIQMGQLVEKAIEMATSALIQQDTGQAEKVVAFDQNIDEMEKEIEQLCLKLLRCQQPVAGDLRFISAALKMVTDLERIGDQAADISELTLTLSQNSYIKNLDHIEQMAVETTDMVIKSIEAYIENDAPKARKVIAQDDVVDALFMETKRELVNLIHEDINNGEQASDLLMVAKYFERIGDHATNIAEWVIFSITGEMFGE
ncbi:MAG: phosphate signaling complex protein PhoU [Eubacteriales bacterium]|nr:phosphate signaling complex protein PhoU [Eubacteriales bacterium]